jgi:hypothetical protein
MGNSVKHNWSKLGTAKLESSGLTTKQAESLGMFEVPSGKQFNSFLEARPALVLPYFGLNGKAASASPKWPEFFRVRYLDKGTSVAAMATDKGDQRYAQPPRTGVCAYFPKNLNWMDIADDPSVPIIITEGELKAAAASFDGWATIGLGGVWNFRSSSQGSFFLPELEKITWVQRNVYITYDSDFSEKPGVCFAINALAEELLERGALPFAVLLPDVYEDDRKTGLDDYLLNTREGEFQTLLELAQPLTVVRSLWQINRKVVYVRDPGVIAQLDNGLKMSPAAFKEHSDWATLYTSEQKVTAEGDISVKKVPAAPVWVKWPMRRSVARITYAPGQPRITDDNMFNEWEGWGATPRKGNVKPFLDLVKFVFKDMEPAAMEWFLDWCAYPIQNPGTKLFTCVVVWGVEEGTGKSLLGYTLGRIYGTNFKELTDDDLENQYTGWAANKQFLMGDEITGSDNRRYANKFKRLITQRTFTINAKYIPEYTVPDCINYFFTSNHADAFFMSDKDRRMFVVEVVGGALSQKFYDDYDDWLWNQGGHDYLMQWFLDRKIAKNFTPSMRAPETAAKQRMIKAGKGELSSWIGDLLEQPDQILRIGKMRHTRDMFTSSELLSIFKNAHPDTRVTAIGLGKQLSNAGVLQAAGGSPLRAPDGTMGRYYIIRNRDRWAREKDRKKLEAEIKKMPVPDAR